MAKFNQDVPQFGSAKPANTGGSQHCAQCEAMLADALDGTLTAEEQQTFDLHMAGCDTCSQMLADAQRGAAWLEMLRTPRPEPPAALLERLLSQTSAPVALHSLSIVPAQASSSHLAPAGIADASTKILPFRSRAAAALRGNALSQSMLQPRLAMTAAMAFFSIGLTLNLTGVKLNELRASDLKPANLRRSFYQANAHVVRYYDNLKVVYELESRVRDLQHTDDSDATPTSQDKAPVPSSTQPEQKQTRPRPKSGTSRRQDPIGTPITVASFEHSTSHPEDTAVSPPLRLTTLAHNRSARTPQEGELV